MDGFFPRALSEDISVVFNAIPKKTYHDVSNWVSDEKTEYQLISETVAIPYRIYLLEPLNAQYRKAIPE